MPPKKTGDRRADSGIAILEEVTESGIGMSPEEMMSRTEASSPGPAAKYKIVPIPGGLCVDSNAMYMSDVTTVPSFKLA